MQRKARATPDLPFTALTLLGEFPVRHRAVLPYWVPTSTPHPDKTKKAYVAENVVGVIFSPCLLPLEVRGNIYLVCVQEAPQGSIELRIDSNFLLTESNFFLPWVFWVLGTHFFQEDLFSPRLKMCA